MMIIGENTFAKKCYQAALSASLMGTASRQDAETCKEALFVGGLKPRDMVATHVNRGIVNTAYGDHEAANGDYERALRIRGHGGEVYANRGNLRFLQRDYQKAMEDYDKALDMEMMGRHIAHLNRGMVSERLGRLQSARQDYEIALEIQPEWAKAIELLTRVERKISLRARKLAEKTNGE